MADMTRWMREIIYDVYMIPTPNLLALVLSLVLSAGLGFVWYSPLLFGDIWRKGMGWGVKEFNTLKKETSTRMVLMPVAILLTILGINWLLELEMVFDLTSGWAVGLLFWGLGLLPMLINNFVFGRIKWQAVAIDAMYQLCVCLLTASILTLWS